MKKMPSAKSVPPGKRKSASPKCDLQFPVGRIKRYLKNRLGQKQRLSPGSAVFMAATLEYLSGIRRSKTWIDDVSNADVSYGMIHYSSLSNTEILELAGNCAKELSKKRIVPRHVMLAVRNDEELNKLCGPHNVIFPGSGVLPFIFARFIPHPPLIPTPSGEAFTAYYGPRYWAAYYGRKMTKEEREKQKRDIKQGKLNAAKIRRKQNEQRKKENEKRKRQDAKKKRQVMSKSKRR